MTRSPFLDTPEAWTRTPNTCRSRAEIGGCIETSDGRVIGLGGAMSTIPTVPSWWRRLVRLFRRG